MYHLHRNPFTFLRGPKAKAKAGTCSMNSVHAFSACGNLPGIIKIE